MGDKAITGVVAIVTAIIGVAIIAVLVSKSSDTSNVLSAGGNAFANILKTAVSPVSGGGGLGSSSLSGLFGNGFSSSYLGG
jgi:hypothetical protein